VARRNDGYSPTALFEAGLKATPADIESSSWSPGGQVDKPGEAFPSTRTRVEVGEVWRSQEEATEVSRGRHR
jgi:hypothetical protein